MGWVSPTGFEDPDDKWLNEANAYDEDTNTYSYTSSFYHEAWTPFIIFTHAALISNKLRYNCYRPEAGNEIDVDVYKDGSWVDVYQGTFEDHTWEEKTFTQGSVTKARIRLYVTGHFRGLVYEFDFWEVEIVTPTVTTQDATDIGID